MGVKLKKLTLRKRIDVIAETLNIPEFTVTTIINDYLESIEASLKKGETVVIDNIVSISLKLDGLKVKNSEKVLLQERVKSIADYRNIPKNSVLQILRGYLDSLEQSALAGETIVIDNIVTIKFTTLCGNIKTYSRVSPYLKNKLTLQQSDITVSTRVSPALRAKVKI